MFGSGKTCPFLLLYIFLKKVTRYRNCNQKFYIIFFSVMRITTSFTVILLFIFIINQFALSTKILQNKKLLNYLKKRTKKKLHLTCPKRIPQLEQFC